MNKIVSSLLFMLCMHSLCFSQVGIGNTNPQAELDITTTNGSLPALNLTPQTSATGTATGQLSVIGDQVFMYDGGRGKWLSVELLSLGFGRNGNSDNINLKTAGNQSNNRSGYLMPFDGTITYASIKSNDNSGAQAKQFSIQVRNANTTLSSTNATTASSEYSNASLNIDFAAGDYINIRINTDGNGNVNNVAALVCVKWRQ